MFREEVTSSQHEDVNEWQRQIFESDDDLLLPISVYLGSSQEQGAVIQNVVQMAYAYGFTNVVRAVEAPGSFYFQMEVEFGNRDKQQARQLKKKLSAALVGKKPPADGGWEGRYTPQSQLRT